MCNQCIEQCAIYTFVPVGPTCNGPLGPISLFWLILRSSVKGGIYQGVLRMLAVPGTRP